MAMTLGNQEMRYAPLQKLYAEIIEKGNIMDRSDCDRRKRCAPWHWREAFDKFGFDDGDGCVQTHLVAKTLEKAGYAVKSSKWGPHNTLIYAIEKEGVAYMPDENSSYWIGYDDPRDYLPREIIDMLDTTFPPDSSFSAPARRFKKG